MENLYTHRNRWNAQTKSSADTWVEEAYKSETHLGSSSVSNEECNGLSEQDVTVLREKWSYNEMEEKNALSALGTDANRDLARNFG